MSAEGGFPPGSDLDSPTAGLPELADAWLRESTVGMALVGSGGEIRVSNPAFARMLGAVSPERLRGVPLRRFLVRGGVWEQIADSVRDQGNEDEREVEIDRRDGGRIWLLLGASLLEGVASSGAEADDNLPLLISAVNITDWKSTERRLERLANRDPLTGVANRRLLQEAMENALALADRHGRQAALLYADLRHFKHINDSFGHGVGDRVLTHVADRLRARGRDSDLTARIGGDEFAVFLSEVEDGVQGARRAAERLLEGFHAPIEVDGQAISVQAAIGISVYPDHARSVRSLLRLADQAMYQAKAWEAGQILVWGDDTADSSGTAPGGEVRRESPAPAGTVVGAGSVIPSGGFPDRDQLELHWQPIQRASDGAIVGAEALLRGRHPTRGLLPAREFIGRARELGWIASFDGWVLECAAARMTEWAHDGPVDWIALNLAPQSLLSSEYMDTLDDLVSTGELDPGDLLLQVALDPQYAPVVEVGRVMRSLRESGFGTALDLGAESEEVRALLLEVLPVDVVEVTPDRLSAEDDGHMLLAKMIETEEQYRRARGAGCELIEGIYVGRPGPAEQLMGQGSTGPELTRGP